MALPSAHDVARRAGVSQATVSRAFTPGASISPAVKARVMEAAEQIGYRPNLLARSLIMGRSEIVGVVMGDTRNPFYVSAFSMLSHRLAEAGLQMLVFTSSGDEPSDLLIQQLLKYRVDAVLLMSAHLSSDLAARCQDEDIPVIFFNREASAVAKIRSVTGANAIGAKAIAAHLLDQGYRTPAFMAGLPDSSTSRDREAAFIEYLFGQGMARPYRVVGNFDRVGAGEAMRELMALREPPDAVFCANDVMAIASIEIARHEFGLHVGRDIGIAGFDDIDQASWPSFCLTSYSQPLERMIDGVMTMLTKQADGRLAIEGALAIRSSTRRNPL